MYRRRYGVPDLKSDFIASEVEGIGVELDAFGITVGLVEDVFDVSEDERCFPGIFVTDDYDFEVNFSEETEGN